MNDDRVFKALADPARRRLLDSLHARGGQNLTDLTAGHGMTRQAVTKHLKLLENANLVVSAKRGRERLHYLNPVPIQEIADRWIGKFHRAPLRALADLKETLEGNET
jgi:DNA-binding transcriptional ArsR family regulator